MCLRGCVCAPCRKRPSSTRPRHQRGTPMSGRVYERNMRDKKAKARRDRLKTKENIEHQIDYHNIETFQVLLVFMLQLCQFYFMTCNSVIFDVTHSLL